MKVLLAGYNLDTEVISDLKRSSGERQDITPETLSASYARISRDPRPVDELRADARNEVEKARKSNKSIIFEMGHHSVAEHAVFNFDIIGVSRLAIEELEHFRLCSYTEKSQRYIKLENDFVIPSEIKGGQFEEPFVSTVHAQNELYHKLFDKLKEYFFNKHKDLAQDPKNHKMIEGYAKEDARYIASLATEGQLGETINARNLELLLRRFASHGLSEIRELGKSIYEAVNHVAPSIIIFTEANDFDQKTYNDVKQFALNMFKEKDLVKKPNGSVELDEFTPDGDDTVVASFLHTASNKPYSDCWKIVRGLKQDEKKELIKKALSHMELFDSAPREFEYADLTFNLVVSSACFGQLKRHRLASIVSQPYDPDLGVTIPDSIKEVKMDKDFMEMIKKTNDVYHKIYSSMPTVAQYVLTNSHRKRVLLKTNARELYHISRLREDALAQWDIRRISGEMSKLAKKAMPLTMMLIGGKDNYPEIYKSVYGKYPKIIKAELPS